MQVHILNGDALKDQFPDLPGETIVAREAMIDGSVQGSSLDEIYENRKQHFEEFYDVKADEYEEQSISEINKIKNLTDKDEVNLWFEDDLFCQANIWFVTFVLLEYTDVRNVFLVRPNDNLQYGFGGLNKDELKNACYSRIKLNKNLLQHLEEMWKAYQADDFDVLKNTAKLLTPIFPRVEDAVEAHIARFPTNGGYGRPEKSIVAIMEELQTKDFVTVFRAFYKKEAIYGFGDLQVKRMFDRVVS